MTKVDGFLDVIKVLFSCVLGILKKYFPGWFLIQSEEAFKMAVELFFERNTSAGLEVVRYYFVQKPSW